MTRLLPALAATLVLLPACTRAERAAPTPSPRPTASPTPAPTASPAPADPFARAAAYESDDPAELARRLVEAESAIRSDAPVGELLTHGLVQQAAYRQLVRQPEWRAQVMDLLPGSLRSVALANVDAGAELRALTKPRDELPDWRIVAPPPADALLAHYRGAERQFGVAWPYLAAIHLVETRMGRIRGVSTAGARGPMQFLPSTWARWGRGDIENPRDAILAAARFLQGHGAPGDMPRALYAYNPSPRYVRAIELYAHQMRTQERAYFGYYHWQVYYRTTSGDALLEAGWTR